jgi:ABC-type multidrug transport system fused ATPase/permease subunit
MQYIIKILHTKPEAMSDSKNSLKLSNAKISFNNVGFAYDNHEAIIKNLSFIIPARKTIAIVGKSGCGKSLLVKLLLRFYEPNCGNITIDDVDLKAVSIYSIRAAIAVIPQDTAIFNRSIYENIIYGNPQATPIAVTNAIQAANLQEFIAKLPYGVNTIVGEHGVKISGGERQRIAIARAILKNAAIYVFDEATSSLDLRTERIIYNNLAQISKNSTTLIIAHRLSAITHANQILVMDMGKIVECGTHLDLMQHNGIYANMWQTQQMPLNLNEIVD